MNEQLTSDFESRLEILFISNCRSQLIIYYGKYNNFIKQLPAQWLDRSEWN